MPRLTRTEILEHPLFPSIEKQIAKHLISIHLGAPRMSRLKSSHRKWLMTQCLFSIALRRSPDDPMSGLTTTRFVDTILREGIASRNTATGFVAEWVAYKFLRDAPDVPDRRVRIFELTEIILNGVRSWFDGHLACLDRLDGGCREALSKAHPALFRQAQPQVADMLVADPIWRTPPDTIGHFLWCEQGGIVLHDLIERLADDAWGQERLPVGKVKLIELSTTYQVSATNLKRMFQNAEGEQLLGWEMARRRGCLWLHQRFVEDYFIWQSAKFAAIDSAFHDAADRRGLDTAEVALDGAVIAAQYDVPPPSSYHV